jgi:hypothetical protein
VCVCVCVCVCVFARYPADDGAAQVMVRVKFLLVCCIAFLLVACHGRAVPKSGNPRVVVKILPQTSNLTGIPCGVRRVR